jgi:hypothetical protein
MFRQPAIQSASESGNRWTIRFHSTVGFWKSAFIGVYRRLEPMWRPDAKDLKRILQPPINADERRLRPRKPGVISTNAISGQLPNAWVQAFFPPV